MNATTAFWTTSYLRSALPAIGATGFNAGLAIHVSMINATGPLLLAVIVMMSFITKLSFNHISSKEHYLRMMGLEGEKSRFGIGYARLLASSILIGIPLMSVAQYGTNLIMILAILFVSWVAISEGIAFEKVVKEHKERTGE